MIALTILLYLRLIETGWVKDIVILVMIYVLGLSDGLEHPVLQF